MVKFCWLSTGLSLTIKAGKELKTKDCPVLPTANPLGALRVPFKLLPEISFALPSPAHQPTKLFGATVAVGLHFPALSASKMD